LERLTAGKDDRVIVAVLLTPQGRLFDRLHKDRLGVKREEEQVDPV
jgi:hypothetical protein